MRIVLGLSLLAALFVLAVVWQKRIRAADLAGGQPTSIARASAHAYPSDWGRILVGARSGSEPVEPARAAPLVLAPDPRADTVASAGLRKNASAAPAPSPREFELVVPRGGTLSTICQAHYQSARAELVRALARYNHIDDPALVREGQKLRLPPLETLLAR